MEGIKLTTPNWYAVFKAEYFTTTANFRKYRKWIPIYFVGGILFFSFLIRALIDFIRGDNIEFINPPVAQFYAIISVFTFFTLFAPIISPLGRIVYDGSAQSRREVSLSSPVKAHELLYGNLLSNMVFFLPFYVLVGTVSLSFFIGNGVFSPLVSSFYLLSGLVLLIILGLFGGTIVTPLVFNFIANQRNDISRAIVTLFVALLLMLALPLLQGIINIVEQTGGDLGWIAYLPFTVGATIIIYGLYGTVVGLNITQAFLLLIFYNVVVIGLGYVLAERLYNVAEPSGKKIRTVEGGFQDRLYRTLAAPIPDKSTKTIFVSMMKSSFRDIEHISRLSIGLASTIFFLYALSGRGLFQDTTNFTGEIQNAVILFSLILSASTTIYIEAASFTIQHKSMLSLIKSSPKATRRFVLAKIMQMFFFQTPIFIVLLLIINYLDVSADINIISFALQLFVIIISLICFILGIYLVNPADNEEDLTNFINLLIFYSLSLFVAVFPIAQVIGGFASELQLALYFTILLLTSIVVILLGIKSLDEMNIETLSSRFQSRIKTIFTGTILTLISFNLLPLLGLSLFLVTNNLILLIVITASMPLLFPLMRFLKKPQRLEFHLNQYNLLLSLLTLTTMFISGFLATIFITFTSLQPSFVPIGLVDIPNLIILSFILIFVVVEEIFFRQYLYEYFEERNYIVTGMIVSTILFALFHFLTIFSFLNAIIGGALLIFLRYKTRSIVYPIIVHLLYNSTLFILSI